MVKDRRKAKGQKKTGQGIKLDVYQLVTGRILEKLAAGVVPWRSERIGSAGIPQNFATGRRYRGINVFLLGCSDFASPYFLTYRQTQELGGNVRKGEKGSPVVKMGKWEPENSESGGAGKEKTERFYLRAYTVFNASQIDGIEFPEVPKSETFKETDRTGAARRIVAEMPNPPAFFEGCRTMPSYSPKEDAVHMPSRETYFSEQGFYSDLFHELAHSTGHESRLSRKSLLENRGFSRSGEASKIYGLEELVAEMAAAFLGAEAGIIEDDFENSAAYLKGWMDVLQVRDHRKWLVQAASDAQRAVDYITGRGKEEAAG